MPKVSFWLSTFGRGDDYNIYVRDKSDVYEGDNTYRADEYPHLHIRVSGNYAGADIIYAGITFGSGSGIATIDFVDDYAVQMTPKEMIDAIRDNLGKLKLGDVQLLVSTLPGAGLLESHPNYYE